MKKLVSLMVALVFLFSFALAGCGDVEPYKQKIADLEQKIEELENASGTHEEEFEEVYSIVYGDAYRTNATSSVKATLGAPIEITEEEFSEIVYIVADILDKNISKDTRTIELKEGDCGKYADIEYVDENILRTYYKREVESVIYNMVSIKFISERECLIKDNSGTIKVISDYFKVEYFTD